jgi:hypothetical protein
MNHLADVLRVLQAHTNTRSVWVESAQATVKHLALRTSTETLTQPEQQLVEKLEQGCGRKIAELAKVAETWQRE